MVELMRYAIAKACSSRWIVTDLHKGVNAVVPNRVPIDVPDSRRCDVSARRGFAECETRVRQTCRNERARYRERVPNISLERQAKYFCYASKIM